MTRTRIRAFSLGLAVAGLGLYTLPALGVEIGGSTYNADTTINDPATWSSGDVSIADTVTVTLAGGLTFTGGDKKITSGGTLINQGTFDHDTGDRVDLDGSGVTFINEGVYNYNHTAGTRQLSLRAGTTFVNTGTINVNSTVNTRYELNASNNLFFNDGGTINVNTANLVIDQIEFRASTGSQFNLADGRMIQINGKVRDEIVGTIDPNFGNGKLVINGNVNVVSSTLTLNVTGGGGVTFQGSEWNLTGGSGADVTNEGRFTHETTNRVRIDDYTFTNETGAVYHYVADGTNILASTLGSTGQYVNRGLLHIGGTSGNARIEGNGLFHNETGTVQVDAGRNLQLEGNVRASASSIFNIAGGSQVIISGAVSNQFITTVTGDGEMVLTTTNLQYTGGNDTITFNVDGNGLITRTGTGTGGTLGNGSNEVVNNGILILDQNNGRFGTSGSGTFTNNGTMILLQGDRYDFGNNATFFNSSTGFVDISGHSSDVALTLRNSGAFVNEGTFFKDSAQTARIEGGNSTVSNTGTFEVRQGHLRVQRPVLQNATSTLTAGTWNVLDGGTLTFENSANNITTIGSDAAVRLGSGATFDRIDSVTTVEGTFGLWDGKVFTTGGSLTTPGILEFGLGAFIDQGSGFDDRTLLSIIGDAIFSSGQVFIEDLGLTEGIYRIIEWTGDRTDELSLANTGNDFFNWELLLTDTNSGHYDLIVTQVPDDTGPGNGDVIPEPTAATLALMGAAGLLLRRRRLA